MNINTVFARVTSAFNTQMDAHLRAVAEGKQTAEAPANQGVVLYANVANEGTLVYTIRSYRIRGQSECSLPTTEQVCVKSRDLDLAAAAYGYALEGKPTPGYIYTLRYLPKGAIKQGANHSPAARAATANSRQAAALTASTTTGSAAPKNPTLLPPEQRIKVVNVAGMPANSPGIWYCGRDWAGWKAGVLGNRHHMKSEANRGEAAEKFANDLWAAIQAKGPMYWELIAMQRKLEAGETVTLGCWCAPKVCHCDTIRKAVLRLMAGQPAATTPTAPTPTAEQPAPQSATRPSPARAAAAAASATQAMAEPSAEPDGNAATSTTASAEEQWIAAAQNNYDAKTLETLAQMIASHDMSYMVAGDQQEYWTGRKSLQNIHRMMHGRHEIAQGFMNLWNAAIPDEVLRLTPEDVTEIISGTFKIL